MKYGYDYEEYRIEIRSEDLIRFLPVDTGRERSGSDKLSRPCLVEGDAQKAELFTHPFTQMINGGYASDFCRADVQRALSAMETGNGNRASFSVCAPVSSLQRGDGASLGESDGSPEF